MAVHWFPRITNRLNSLRQDLQQARTDSVRDVSRNLDELTDIVAELAQAVAEMQKPDAQDQR